MNKCEEMECCQHPKYSEKVTPYIIMGNFSFELDLLDTGDYILKWDSSREYFDKHVREHELECGNELT